MNPVTHFLFGWAIANVAGLERKRDRALVAIAGIIPDMDGLGAIPEMLTRGSARPLLWFSDYHHTLGHNVGFALVVAAAGLALAQQRRALVGALVAASFHLHLACDILGARGPDGSQWPIPYLLPFSHAWDLTWSQQWPLNGWQNFAITGALIAATFRWAWARGYSPLEMISPRADRAFVEALRRRVPPR